MTHPPRARPHSSEMARAHLGAAVSEIATLRAELSGPQVG
jgi:hypothetical protein